MITVKLTAIGNSLGVLLPRELLARLRLQKGDTLTVLETPNGIELSPYAPEVCAQLDVLEDMAHQERSTLRLLAEQGE